KRQEVQNAIELLSTGAPVSALIDHGLAESTVDALVRGNIGTVERLGNMTPEELEAIDGIDEDAVGRIQQAINSFYGQEYQPEAIQTDGPPIQEEDLRAAAGEPESPAGGEPESQDVAAAAPEAIETEPVADDVSSASDTMVESTGDLELAE